MTTTTLREHRLARARFSRGLHSKDARSLLRAKSSLPQLRSRRCDRLSAREGQQRFEEFRVDADGNESHRAVGH